MFSRHLKAQVLDGVAQLIDYNLASPSPNKGFPELPVPKSLSSGISSSFAHIEGLIISRVPLGIK